MPGHKSDDALELIRSFRPAPLIYPRKRTCRVTGEYGALSYFVHLDFTRQVDAALMPLGEVAALLGSFPWAHFPGLTVNRIDLASDHLVPDSPVDVCDRVADLRLPYCRPYRGPKNTVERWLTIYHNGGKARTPKVVVAHYPRLESLLHRNPNAAAAAVRYAEHRVRQEIRFRGQGLRRRVGSGSMTPDVVLGSFPVFVRFAEKRLRRVFREGILSTPGRDLEGEAAMASAVESWLWCVAQLRERQY